MNHFEEYKKNLAYHFSEITEHPFAGPYWVYISLLHKCTYNCRMCEVVKILKSYELPLGAVKNVLDTIADRGWGSTVVLTGGEPFLRKDIFSIIEYAVSKGVKVEAVSNGSLINEEFASRIISSGLTNIAVSLDGAREETHDFVREKGAFRKAANALKLLSEAKKNLGKGPQISAWTTIMKENVKELSDVIPLVRNLGVECLVYHPVIVAQDDMQNTSPEAPFWIRGDDIEILKTQINKIADYRAKHGLVAFLHDPHLWIKYFEGKLVKDDWKCNPFVFMNIGPDGEARSCGSSFGNIKESGLNACLNTEGAIEARKLMKACQKPCLQTCWAMQEADYLSDITDNFISNIRESNLPTGEKKEIIKEAVDILTQYEKLLKEKHG